MARAAVQSLPVNAGQGRFVLHGVGPFRRAVATATVTRLSQTQFSLQIRAACLGSPASLYTTFPRHAYVAWLVNGTLMQGPMRMAAVGLALDPHTVSNGTRTRPK